MKRAVKAACRYVEVGIRTAEDIGAGNGPINHFHSVYTLPFAPYVNPPPDIVQLLTVLKGSVYRVPS